MKLIPAVLVFVTPCVALAQIPPPELIYPEDGGWRWVDDHQEWSDVPEAELYRAQIAWADSDFGEIVADTLIEGTHWKVQLWDGFYEWRVAASDGAEWSEWSEVWTFESRFPIDNEPPAGAVNAVSLEPAFPNPSRGSLTIRFHAPTGADVDLRAYDVLGRMVAVLYGGPGQQAGEVIWDTGSLSAGTYILRLSSETGAVATGVVVVW